MAFFGAVLFPLLPGAVSFDAPPLVSALPHGTSFIPTLISKMIRSFSLCWGTSRGSLDCCVHLLQLWFCGHLSVVSRDQLEGFAIRSRF